jgi:hypothetical protein
MGAELRETREPGRDGEASEDEGERRAGGRLRSAMLADGQPSFPWWLPLPGIALALVWAAYRGVSAEDAAGAVFLEELVWPGLPILVLTTVTSYFGWRLDLD